MVFSYSKGLSPYFQPSGLWEVPNSILYERGRATLNDMFLTCLEPFLPLTVRLSSWPTFLRLFLRFRRSACSFCFFTCSVFLNLLMLLKRFLSTSQSRSLKSLTMRFPQAGLLSLPVALTKKEPLVLFICSFSLVLRESPRFINLYQQIQHPLQPFNPPQCQSVPLSTKQQMNQGRGGQLSENRTYNKGMLHNMQNQNGYRTWLLLLLSLLVVASSNYISMSVTPSSLVIYQVSSYQFILNRQFDPVNLVFTASPSSVSLNSIIAIQFPSQFLTVSSTSTVACTNTNGDDLGCTLNSATRTVTISKYYQTSATLANPQIIITLPNIVNAYKAGATGNFYWQIADSSGNVIDQGPPAATNYLSTSLTFSPATFQSCALSASNAYVITYSPLTFTISPKNPIPAQGKLVIAIPTAWTSDPLSQSTFTTSPTCTAISGLGSSSLSCSYNSGQAQLTITGITTTLSSAFSFSVSNILTPPTVGSSQIVSVYSEWDDGTIIDTCSTTVSDLNPAPFQTISLASNDNTTVQTPFTAKLQVTLSRAFYYQDTIVMVLPGQFLGVSVSSVNFASMTRTPNLNTLTLSNFPSSPTTIASNNVITFVLSSITNPLSTQPLALNISFYRNSQIYQTSSASYTATSGTLSAFTIAPDSNFVHITGAATITLDSALTFPAGSILTLTFPSSVSATDSVAALVTSCSLNGTVKTGVTFEISSNQIIFRNIFVSSFKGTVVLKISSFTNPPTTQPSTYSLAAYDSSSYVVLTSSYVLTAATKALASNSVTANSLTVLATGVTITVSLTTNYPFTAVSIQVPAQIAVGSSFSSTCAPNSFSSCTLAGQNLTFFGTQGAGSYQLSWGYNTNPNSLEPSSSFTLTTYLQGWAVETSKGVLSLTMTSQGSFKTLLVTPSSKVNSATISLSLSLTAPSGTPAGTLTAVLPSQLGLASSSASGCTLVAPNLICAWTAGATSLTLSLTNVQNTVSFQPVSAIQVSLTNSNNFGSLTSSVSGWTNEVASAFSTAVSGTNNYKAQTNNFLFSLSGLPGGQSYVRITINSAFPILSTAPTGTTLVSDHILDASCTGTSCSANIALTNPSADGTFTFTLTTYTSSNYTVGTSTSNTWTYDCSGTSCRSCLSNSSCLSCYSSALTSYSIFSTATSTCISACSTGYFLVGAICTPCDSNCSQCSSTAIHCTACPSDYYLDTTYALCVPSCLSGYFSNAFNRQCDACTAPCVTCITTAITCLSCNSTTYLFGNECRTSCPTGTHIANPTTSNCDPCDSNCLTCSGTITTCASCNTSSSLYLQVNKCVSVCSSNYYLVNEVCTYCQAPCKTCTVSVSACASCFLDGSFPVYFNGTCTTAAQCSIGHYLNTSNSSCESCPSQCTQCSSSTSCSLCSASHYLYQATCLGVCPNTTYQYTNASSGYCLTCSPCATCSAMNTCTSCSVGTYLYLSTCYSTCPNSTYPSSTVCASCPPECPLCQNATYCLSCISTLYLRLGTCYSTCPNGTYPSGLVCSSCPAVCASCVSASSCQSCSTGYSLENNQCVQVCSVGLSYNQLCYPCGLYCAICSNSTGICSLCETSYLLYNNTCITACPSTQVALDGLACASCSNTFVNCSTCNTSQCLSCTYGQLVGGACKPCDPGYYQLSGACIICPSACSACTSQTECQVCASSYYLYGSKCTSECPRNMVPNGTVCSFCSSQCSICNLTSSLCSVCNAGVYLYDNACFSTCPSPLVVSYDFLSCVTEQVYYQQFSQNAKIIPFPFSIAAAVLIILGYILRCFHPQMHLQTVLCAGVGLVELCTWAIFIAFQLMYWNNFHETARLGFLCGCVGVALLYLLNAVHARLYCVYIGRDEQFLKWYRYHSCSNCVVVWLASMLSFKFYRLIHSKFLGKEALSLVLSSVNQLVPFSLLGVLSLLLCSLPICVGCALALYNSISQDQQFFIALDTLVVTGIMVLLILMDLRHTDDYFHDDHEAKNLKRKIYEEDSIKFQVLNGNSENSSAHVAEGEDAEAVEGNYADTGQKFKSTFQHTKLLEQPSSQTKIRGEEDESEFQLQESEGDQGANLKGKWEPVKFDSHGYQLKYDSNNNLVRYDQHGYLVEIDEQGNHKRYNQLGQEVRIIDGKHRVFDQNGYEIIDGKPHDERGYEVRQQNGETTFYDSRGFRVVGYPPDEVHLDEEGNRVEIDEDGAIHLFTTDGFEVVEHKGRRLLKDKDGHFVRKNDEGQWQMYDPEDGFTLRPNSETGILQKYDQWGFRVEIDQFGQITRFDQDGNKITVLPGGVVIRHDAQGYRVEKDPEGKLHRYDKDGYELVVDQQGRPKLIDQNGYTVQKDLYGTVTLFDQQGLRVEIDHETGKHRRFNQEGLEVTVDAEGNRVLKDKRGKTVRQLEGDTFEKYDEEGNKIFLDDNGYEVEYDSEGNIVMFDKVGDRVETEYDIEQSEEGDNFQSLLGRHNKPSKYKYKATNTADNEAELQRLMLASQPFTFEEEEELSELRQFHDDAPPGIEAEKQLEQLVSKERSQLELSQTPQELAHLAEFQFQEELDDVAEMNPSGLPGTQAYTASQALNIREGEQHEYDREALARDLDDKEPDLLAIKRRQDLAAAEARKRDLNRILQTPKGQIPIEIKSVADINLEERSFENEGVQPMENRTQMDEFVDELEVPLGKGKRGNRSEAYLSNGKKATQTVYNFNTVEVEIKNQNKLYDEEEEIESLHEDDWQEEPPVFASKEGSSNANTNIVFLEDHEDNNDALTELIQKSESKHHPRALPRYPNHDILSGRSIQQIQEQLFGQAGEHPRERKEFKLSGAPNPLVEYAKAMEANRKSLQEKMYLDGYYKQ